MRSRDTNLLPSQDVREGRMLHLVTGCCPILRFCVPIWLLNLNLSAMHGLIPYLLVISKLICCTLLLFTIDQRGLRLVDRHLENFLLV